MQRATGQSAVASDTIQFSKLQALQFASYEVKELPNN
jgi:hypothetical protein